MTETGTFRALLIRMFSNLPFRLLLRNLRSRQIREPAMTSDELRDLAERDRQVARQIADEITRGTLLELADAHDQQAAEVEGRDTNGKARPTPKSG